MSPPPDGVNAQFCWSCGTATRTYSLYLVVRFICSMASHGPLFIYHSIHRIPESDKPDPQSRKKDDLQLIEKLFGELEVDYEPKQCFRLGRFDKEAGPDTRKPRPLKIIMNSQEEQAQVMMNLSKLRDAPEFLKKLSISPDLSREEQDELNEKLREAKQLTSESPNLIFKVKGTPGNYHFIKILKSRNDQKTSLSSKPAPINQVEPSKTTAETDA